LEYRKLAYIRESQLVSDGKVAVENILNSFKTVIVLQRGILKISEKVGDEGTNALMSGYIRA
jgi:starvation-inducible DNA-binding protein